MTLLSSRDVCKKLGIAYHKLEYLFFHGQIAEPHRTTGGRRLFSEADIKRIATFLKKQKQKSHQDSIGS
jgi:DNA-binding transcriptional MerR regulator